MKVIGITGGIGSGKSDVLNYLESNGAYVVEADKLAHTLMEPGGKVYNKIVEHFGNAILCDDGRIDRKQLGSIVFADENALQSLNSIVHPQVKDFIKHDIENKRSAGKTGVYVIEAALLIQDGYRLICDEIWYIYVNRDERVKRLVKGRGGEASSYISVIDNQDTDEYYMSNSDVVVDNNGPFKKTEAALKELLNKSICCDTITD